MVNEMQNNKSLKKLERKDKRLLLGRDEDKDNNNLKELIEIEI
jgi:predicted GIY-YIG superfamily endonuclease